MTNIGINKIVIVVLLSLLSFPLLAQDLIVTNEGDSLNCKITKVKSDNIYFTFKYNDEIRSTLLPVSDISNYQYGYYSTVEVPPEKIVGNEIYPHYRMAVNVGWNYRTARLSDDIPADFKQYYNELKSGYNYGLDLTYYFSEQLGVGFRYNNYLSKNEIDNVYVTYPDASTEYGKMSDHVSTNFIGPFFSTRLFNFNKKNCFLFDLGIGYMGYKDQSVLISDQYILKGNTVGTYLNIGYDIGVSPDLAIGFQLSLSTGNLTQFQVFENGVYTETKKLEKGQYENLSRIDLSIGLRFNK
jgi:hypothetical protein